jgi:uncharacterized membrane protein YiaA
MKTLLNILAFLAMAAGLVILLVSTILACYHYNTQLPAYIAVLAVVAIGILLLNENDKKE